MNISLIYDIIYPYVLFPMHSHQNLHREKSKTVSQSSTSAAEEGEIPFPVWEISAGVYAPDTER